MALGTQIAVLATLAVIPPLLFLAWFRSREDHDREPLLPVLGSFGYGATLGVLIALLLNIVFDASSVLFLPGSGLDARFVALVVGAPLVEELAKGWGLRWPRPRITEPEDGIVYGAAIGLGFSATENLIYGLDALLSEGESVAFAVLAIRPVSSSLLHAGSSALLGFGYAMYVLRRGTAAGVFGAYLVAVLLHAAFNFLVYTDTFGGFVSAVIMVWVVLLWLGKRIRQLDAESSWSHFR